MAKVVATVYGRASKRSCSKNGTNQPSTLRTASPKAIRKTKKVDKSVLNHIRLLCIENVRLNMQADSHIGSCATLAQNSEQQNYIYAMPNK